MSMSNPSGLSTRLLQEEDYPRWISFLDDAASGSVYSHPDYLETLCTLTGARFRILAVTKAGEIQGGIGLYERSSGGGVVLSNRLLLYYNGIVLRDHKGKYPSQSASKERKVMGLLERELRIFGYAHATFHTRHPVQDYRVFIENGWAVRPSYSYLLHFARLDEAYARIEQNQRRLIQRCEGEGVIVDSDDDFDAFFRMHEHTHRRKGAPLYLGVDAFRTYFRNLSEKRLARLFHARLPGGQPVASQLVLSTGHPVTHTVAAAADPAYLNLGTTPYLRWKVCEALASEGYEANDLTDAALNEVTRFKAQLGGDLVTNFVVSGRDQLTYRVRRGFRRGARRGLSLMKGVVRRFVRPRAN